MALPNEVVGRRGERFVLDHLRQRFPDAQVHGVSGNLRGGQHMGEREALVDIVMFHEGVVRLIELSSTKADRMRWCGLERHQWDLALRLTRQQRGGRPKLTMELAQELRLPQEVYQDLLGRPVVYQVRRVAGVPAGPYIAFTLRDPARMVARGELTWEERPQGNGRPGTWIRLELPLERVDVNGLAAGLAAVTVR